MNRYRYVIPGPTPEIRGDTTGDSEEHVRSLLKVVYGQAAAQKAIVTVEPEQQDEHAKGTQHGS